MSDKPTVEMYENIILDHLKTNREELYVLTHNRRMTYLRSIVFYFLRKYTTLTLAMIGDRYNRDHATVNYSLRNFPIYRNYDEDLNNKFIELEKIFHGKSKIKVCPHCGTYISK